MGVTVGFSLQQFSEVFNFVSSSWNRATKNQKAFNVRRFDCPAFLLTAEETGQTNRL
jgi:hypothetical protein